MLQKSLTDFRYNKSLGGGALIDAGGYTLKYASYLLGESAKITDAHLNYLPNYEVDIKCKAENCVYNEDCICHASGVEIAGNRAECREETACATFCCEQ